MERRAFTIIELLIVIAVIVLLLSILTVAISAASKTSQSANTRALMNSLRQGLISFHRDVGYYPPVLDSGRGLVSPPLPGFAGFETNLQLWNSSTTLADYLLGYDNHVRDGWGVVDAANPNDPYVEESPRLGIRHPLSDGVWGATAHGARQGLLADRLSAEIAAENVDRGPVLGPYLEIATDRILGSTDGSTDPDGNLNVYLPGQGAYDDADPKVLVDYWGRPLRYYRRIYAPGSIQTSFRSLDINFPTPTLAEVVVLRPFRIAEGQAVDAEIADTNGDTSTTMELRTAEFAIFSSGPDRAFNIDVRYDSDELNADNIVEIGP